MKLHHWLIRASLPAVLCAMCLGQTQTLYLGTYTNTDAHSHGIYSVQFDSSRGILTGLAAAAETANPSFLTRHPSRPVLYAVNEQPEGSVSSFAIEPDGSLRLLGISPTGGALPCHLAVDSSGKWLVVANYTGGSVAVLPILPDGRTGQASVTPLSGSGPDPRRQKGPHPHEIVFASKDVILVPDLGADRIARYRFNSANGKLSPASPDTISLPAGSGPRHVALSADGSMLYVVSELANTVTAIQIDKSGAGKVVQTISLLPPHFEGSAASAEIAVHPSGRYLYATIRGADNVVEFSINPKNRRLTLIGAVPTGATPRFFKISADGKWLLAAGQASGNVTVFAIGPGTGLLAAQPNPLSVPAPVFLGAAAAR